MYGEYPSKFHARMYLLQDSDSEFRSVLCLNYESAQWRDRGLCAQQISSYIASSVTLYGPSLLLSWWSDVRSWGGWEALKSHTWRVELRELFSIVGYLMQRRCVIYYFVCRNRPLGQPPVSSRAPSQSFLFASSKFSAALVCAGILI